MFFLLFPSFFLFSLEMFWRWAVFCVILFGEVVLRYYDDDDDDDDDNDGNDGD